MEVVPKIFELSVKVIFIVYIYKETSAKSSEEVSCLKKSHFINGVWEESKDYTFLKSPFTEEKIAEIPIASEEEVEQALAAADRAGSEFSKIPAYQRASILENVANLLNERVDEAAEIISLEAAKPIRAAKEEVLRTVQTYKFSAEEAKRIHGETIPLDAAPGGERRIAYTVRKPIGVIGAITPFNFPMNLVAHKVGPAIAAGNTVVLKPAPQTPLSALFIVELFQEAGLPPGVLNVVLGSGRTIGEKIVSDNRVKLVTFTGSPEVGATIRNNAGLKHVILELGSNAAVIIDKGTKIEEIVSKCVAGAFSFQGQVCISLQRIYVHEKLYEPFVERFVEATKELTIGDPLNSETDVSALISPNEIQRTLDWIEEAKREGAEVAIGGIKDGNILKPTVILESGHSMKVSCNEVFAPIVLINKISSVNEGINLVNNSRYGLQASIYTDNIHLALDAAEDLEVGGVMINDIPTFRVDNMPYGGIKESGLGREGVKYTVEEMTELKLIVIKR